MDSLCNTVKEGIFISSSYKAFQYFFSTSKTPIWILNMKVNRRRVLVVHEALDWGQQQESCNCVAKSKHQRVEMKLHQHSWNDPRRVTFRYSVETIFLLCGKSSFNLTSSVLWKTNLLEMMDLCLPVLCSHWSEECHLFAPVCLFAVFDVRLCTNLIQTTLFCSEAYTFLFYYYFVRFVLQRPITGFDPKRKRKILARHI